MGPNGKHQMTMPREVTIPDWAWDAGQWMAHTGEWMEQEAESIAEECKEGSEEIINAIGGLKLS